MRCIFLLCYVLFKIHFCHTNYVIVKVTILIIYLVKKIVVWKLLNKSCFAQTAFVILSRYSDFLSGYLPSGHGKFAEQATPVILTTTKHYFTA